MFPVAFNNLEGGVNLTFRRSVSATPFLAGNFWDGGMRS